MLSLKDTHARILSIIDAHDGLNTKPSHKVRLTRRTALYLLARRFRKHLLELSRLRSDGAGLSDQEQELPGLKTNRVAMARYMGVSERSVYNYLSFYERMGLLTKKLHGRQNDFEVVLHPWFFTANAATPQVFSFEKTATPPPVFSALVSTFLPPISTQETQENNNFYNKAVENVEKPDWQMEMTEPPRFQESHTHTGNLHKKAVSCPGPSGIAQEEGGGGPKKLSTRRASERLKAALRIENVEKDKSSSCLGTPTGGEGLNNPPSDLEDYGRSLVMQFWEVARTELYADCFYSEKQHGQILTEILNSVFRNFVGVSHRREYMFQRYLFYVDCIHRAKKFANKYHWISFLPAEKYFSEHFYKQQLQAGQKGSFFYVAEWAKADVKRQTAAKKQAWLNNAKRNIALCKSPQGQKLTTRLEIIAYYLHLVQKQGPTYVHQLNDFISNPANFK